MTSFQSFSFGVGGSGPAGTPDQIVMQVEPAPPQCSNGLDDDRDAKIDLDGGAAANHGIPLGPADPQCTQAWRNSEAASSCGLGAELVLLAPLLARLGNRRRPVARA